MTVKIKRKTEHWHDWEMVEGNPVRAKVTLQMFVVCRVGVLVLCCGSTSCSISISDPHPYTPRPIVRLHYGADVLFPKIPAQWH